MMESRRSRPPMRRFDYFAPQSLAEAIALFGEKGEGGRALDGGTDSVPQIKRGGKITLPAYVVSLRRLPELRRAAGSRGGRRRLDPDDEHGDRGRQRLQRPPLRRHCAGPPRLRGG